MTTTGKAPGKFFRKGINLMEAAQLFSSEEKAEEWFIQQRWEGGVIHCPKCDSEQITRRITRKPMPFYCRGCKQYFSVKTGTLLQSSNLPLAKWGMAFYLYSTSLKGVSSMKLHRDLGITQKAAWHLSHRVRESWDSTADRFAGPVEADEMYVGGVEKNKHESKKLKAGRGAVGKTPVVGLKDQATNKVKTQVVESTDGKTLKGFVHMNTEFGAEIHTDEARAYEGLNRPHQTVAHGEGEYVGENGQTTNGMESHWAMFKRGFVGTYHKMSKKHLHRYTREFEGRHNARPLDTRDQMTAMVRGGIGKQLRYADLIGPENTRLKGGI